MTKVIPGIADVKIKTNNEQKKTHPEVRLKRNALF